MSRLLPGFADPVADSQSVFRAVLDAMATPGRLVEVGRDLAPPAPLMPAAACVLLALADAETPLFLAACFAPARDWLAFHCGAPLVPPIAAGFALLDAVPPFSEFDAGSDLAPERSATLIVQVAALGTGRGFMLAGPGLRAPVRFAASGLPPDFSARWADNHAAYPRGIDLLLCAGCALVALPRSVAITDG